MGADGAERWLRVSPSRLNHRVLELRTTKFGRLFWKLLLGNVALLVFVASTCAWFTLREIENLHGMSGSPPSATRVAMVLVLTTLVAAVILTLGLARLWNRRIATVTDAARKLSRGDLQSRISVTGADEVALLARSLNRMREHLAGKLLTIERQRRTVESLVAQLQEGVIVAHANGRLVLVNPQAVRLLHLSSPRDDGSFDGLPVEQCIPQHDLQQLLLPDRRYAGSVAGATMPRPQGEPDDSQPAVAEVKLQVESRKGIVWLLARAVDIVLPDPDARDGQGTLAFNGRLLVLTDVTELTRTIQVKTDFAANASHELRTPLSTIRAAVETLRSIKMNESPADARHFIDVIGRQGERLEAMVVDLLELSKVESPAAQFETHDLDLLSLIDELHSDFAEPLAHKQLDWTLDLPEDCRRLAASDELLRIVLRNLLENSIRFTQPGGHIQITVRSRDTAKTIEVADDGCGIPPEDQDRVFERFYQVEPARSGPDRGTGLGLSIVRHAVAAMRGTVEMQSALGKGTRVTITIPQPMRLEPKPRELDN